MTTRLQVKKEIASYNKYVLELTNSIKRELKKRYPDAGYCDEKLEKIKTTADNIIKLQKMYK
jgi:hypothetical protein